MFLIIPPFILPEVTNGTHRLKDTKAKLKEEGSSSSLKFTKVLPSQVDDLGGVLSPVREDVFENLSATSADANLSTFPLDPTLMGVTLSSSTDTIGSYCDGKADVLVYFNFYINCTVVRV